MAGTFANVRSEWVDGNLVFYDKSGNIIATFDGTNRKLTFPASSTLDISAATLSGAANSVTAAMLGANLATGFINLGIFNCRLLTTNAFLNTIEAGTPDGNTSPSLSRVNGATDKQARLTWAASAVDEIAFPSFVYPPDLDDTAAVTVKVLAAMAGATDTPTLTIGYFEGVGDTDAGGATAAVTGTTVAAYSRTIAASDVAAAPKSASITLTPGAHGTDALYIYGAWVEYTRKT